MALNLPEFYTHQGSQYMKVVNIAGFCICQSFKYPGLTQSPVAALNVQAWPLNRSDYV